jgi:hypothetical protein
MQEDLQVDSVGLVGLVVFFLAKGIAECHYTSPQPVTPVKS